jgi:hypothetical protein
MPEHSAIPVEEIEKVERQNDNESLETLAASFEQLRGALEAQVDSLQKQFKVKHRNLLRWADRNGYNLWFLGQVGGKAAVAGGLMLSLLTSTPQTMTGLPQPRDELQHQQFIEARAKADAVRAAKLRTVQASNAQQARLQQQMMDQLHQLSQDPALMNDATVANNVTAAIHYMTGVPVATSLDGYMLNTNIGRIGAEQHLKRYPGDSLAGHNLTGSGMAPGLGAYGYFAPSASALTKEVADREAWYVAVQTFQSPNWSGNVSATYNWFKFRKVLIYHPVTGKAVVGDIAEAGPALSTGKAYGGSPEVMAALGAHDGHGSPPVLMFFVNDPNNTIPLGPVDVHSLSLGK